MKNFWQPILKAIGMGMGCLFLFASIASAATLISAKEPEKIFEMAKGFGSAELETDDEGDPFISGRIDGTKYSILFYGCKDGKDCDDIQFRASWSSDKITLEDINQWNLTTRFGKAYLDRDSDPVLEMVVNIDYGVSKENLEDCFKWWQQIIGEFKKDVLSK